VSRVAPRSLRHRRGAAAGQAARGGRAAVRLPLTAAAWPANPSRCGRLKNSCRCAGVATAGSQLMLEVNQLTGRAGRWVRTSRDGGSKVASVERFLPCKIK
jgi:hypothetical protein